MIFSYLHSKNGPWSLPGTPGQIRHRKASSQKKLKRAKTFDVRSVHNTKRHSIDGIDFSSASIQEPRILALEHSLSGLACNKGQRDTHNTSHTGRSSVDSALDSVKRAQLAACHDKPGNQHSKATSSEQPHSKIFYRREGSSSSLDVGSGLSGNAGIDSAGVGNEREALYHDSDADDEYEESNSSSMFGSSLNRISSDHPPLLKTSNLAVNGLAVSDTAVDSPKTGMFVPSTDNSESVFSFDVAEGSITTNETEVFGQQVLLSQEQTQAGPSQPRNDTSDLFDSPIAGPSQQHNGASDKTDSVDGPINLLSSGSSDVLSTSSMSIPGLNEDAPVKASSSHDVFGTCCGRQNKTLDRSKLKLDIKGKFYVCIQMYVCMTQCSRIFFANDLPTGK